ncbi:MAG: hypothetical protein JO090_01420, partial [Rhizobacter sp.]|nr:hypothetical protein [Rhizobacter sp.]
MELRRDLGFVSDGEQRHSSDGSGKASVQLTSDENKLQRQIEARRRRPGEPSVTDAELGTGGEMAA